MGTRMRFEVHGADEKVRAALQEAADSVPRSAPKRSRAPSWIVINTAHGGRLECLRCGRHHMPQFPIELWAMSALSKGFEREHRACKLKPEGLHCFYCGLTGHESDGCKLLDAKGAEQWRAGPDTGVSSCTIFGAITGGGYLGGHADIPYDPSDFGRCYRLLRAEPSWRARLGEVAAKHPAWAPFVREWDRLTALYEEEMQRKDGIAPKLYAAMKELECEADGSANGGST